MTDRQTYQPTDRPNSYQSFSTRVRIMGATEGRCNITRPYTRAEVACGWAGAAKKQSVTDRPTDGQSGLQSRVHATKKKMEKKREKMEKKEGNKWERIERKGRK